MRQPARRWSTRPSDTPILSSWRILLLIVLWIFGAHQPVSAASICGKMSAKQNFQLSNGGLLDTKNGFALEECLDECCRHPDCTAVTYSNFVVVNEQSICQIFNCVNCQLHPVQQVSSDSSNGYVTITLTRHVSSSSQPPTIRTRVHPPSPSPSSSFNNDSITNLRTTAAAKSSIHYDGITSSSDAEKKTVTNGTFRGQNTVRHANNEPTTTVSQQHNSNGTGTIPGARGGEGESTENGEESLLFRHCAPFSVLVLLGILLLICTSINCALTLYLYRKRTTDQLKHFPHHPTHSHHHQKSSPDRSSIGSLSPLRAYDNMNFNMHGRRYIPPSPPDSIPIDISTLS